MPTIRKVTRGSEFLHGHGTVAGGETVNVDGDTAAYLVETGDYERAESDESDAESDPDADTTDDTTDTDADEGGGETALEDRTYQELRDLASDHDISGRSDMDKAELIDALDEVV